MDRRLPAHLAAATAALEGLAYPLSGFLAMIGPIVNIHSRLPAGYRARSWGVL